MPGKRSRLKKTAASAAVVVEEEPKSPTPPPSPHQSELSVADLLEAPRKRAQKVTVCRILSDEEEVALADWLKENPCLYNKGLKEYRDVGVRNRLWAEKAEELHALHPEIEGPQMRKTWYDTIRTRVGKLTREASGTAVRKITDRDKFLKNTFSFLATHIARIPSRQGCNVSNHISLPYYDIMINIIYSAV